MGSGLSAIPLKEDKPLRTRASLLLAAVGILLLPFLISRSQYNAFRNSAPIAQVVFAGHDHVYERTKPQKGIQYFITGAGGKMRRGDIDLRSPLRAASYDTDNSFMLIEIDEGEMNFKAISEKGDIVDSGVIKQV